MADIVEMCSGSRQLLRILNDLGCTTSPYMHNWFVTQHAEAQCNDSVWNELSYKAFTVASVDNFDILQSYATVYCGNQSCSYHGTTIQLIKPDATITYPAVNSSQETQVTSIITDKVLLNNNTSEQQPSLPRHRRSTSPGNSPHKLGKTGPKRMRTITTKDLTK